MPDLYTAIPGGMPTGWLKKISLLEKQMAEAQREIVLLKKHVQKLEEDRSLGGPNDPFFVTESPVPVGATMIPIPTPAKRGPGRPRKNPQP